MTRTRTGRRAARAALVAAGMTGALAAAPGAHAAIASNGSAPNAIAAKGARAEAAAPARAADPNRLRLRAVRPAGE